MKKFLGSIGQIIIMALLYFVAARLSLLLAIPPGFATPVWPAAGIALAGGLIFGYPSLIGVFFGSLVANFYVAAGGFSEGLNYQAALVASAIAWGAFAQAALGTYLVRKRLSIPSTLSKLSNLLKIMLYGGAVACLVNATVGPLVLCVVGAVPLSELFLNMLVWWVGDVIGVILFAPLLLILAHSQITWLRKIMVSAPMVLFTAAAILAFSVSKNTQQALYQGHFDRLALTFATEIDKEVEIYKSVLTATQQFINSSEEITSAEFDNFAARFIENYPGIRSIQWAEKVENSQRTEYEYRIRTQGFPNFVIKDRFEIGIMGASPQRDVYFPITYLFPYQGNVAAHGFDIFGPDQVTNNIRQNLLIKARDRGEAVATGRMALVQDEGTYGLAIYNPVYSADMPNDSPESHRKYHIGFTSGVFTMPLMLSNVAALAESAYVDFTLENVSDPQQKILLYDSRTPNAQEPETPIRVSDDIMRATIELDVAGQIWALTIYEQTSNQDAQKNWLLWIVLVGGLLCSAFVGGYIIVLSANTERLEREMRKEGLKAGRALGVATMLTLISLTFSVIVWTEYQKQEHKLISQLAQEEITNITHNIGYRVSETIMALERMAARWEIRQGIPMTEWTYDAANLIKDYNALKVVEWVDNSYHVKWVEPIAGNEAAIGLNVVFDEVRRKALEGAAESDRPTLTPPIDLVQGYRGLIAYVPLNVKDRFDGFIVGIYNLNEFIGGLIPQQFLDSFAIKVVDQDKNVFSNIEARNAKDKGFFYTKTFKVYDREWVFSAEPKPEYFKKHVSKYAYLGLLGGALLSMLIGISVYTMMISNRRNALLLKSERALQAANAELEEFAYRTSHDLRSPVVSSLALAHMLEKHIAEGNQTKAMECLGMMVPAMNKLQSLIEDILNLTRAKSEQEDLVSVDLTEIVADTRAKLSGMDNYDRVSFETDLAVTTIDNILRNRLTLIISNLISNAYKYQDTSQPESYIHLRSYREDDYIVVEVEDNGMGIPSENRAQMFQMFKRFHPKESFGSGLGLYMIKKSAEMLGGDIKYIAKAQGSIFRLVLPD